MTLSPDQAAAPAAPPPRLNFDDGSRIMTAQNSAAGPTAATAATAPLPTPSTTSSRGSAPLREYYEVDAVSSEVVARLRLGPPEEGDGADGAGRSGDLAARKERREDGFLCRVALQFPDDLLPDSAEVAWLVEDAIVSAYESAAVVARAGNDGKEDGKTGASPPPPPLVFVLGDTTYGSCCPDEIGAAHLDADVLVHYGHACLGPTENLPVIYSLGGAVGSDLDVERCVDAVLGELELEEEQRGEKQGHSKCSKFLVLFEVRHHRAVDGVVQLLRERGGLEAFRGRIPKCNGSKGGERTKRALSPSSGCVGDAATAANGCCGEVTSIAPSSPSPCCKVKAGTSASDSQAAISQGASPKGTNTEEEKVEEKSRGKIIIGGLEIPDDVDLSEYTLLYIGDDRCQQSSNNSNRQFLNALLRCNSPGGTRACWSYNPTTGNFNTDPLASSAGVSRHLNRRFYLTQKARLASIFGILVGTLSQSRFRSVIERTRMLIENSGRSCYTFAVGKVNVAKLANYAEVDCFVLVACAETSVLEEERDFHVPVITPLELEVALDVRPWDGFYSHDFGDVLGGDTGGSEGESAENRSNGNKFDDGESGEDDSASSCDEDEPFFSMISGRYESKKKTKSTAQRGEHDHVGGGNDGDVNLQALTGGGQVTEYRSGAAEFWKQREYQGLEANVGQNEVKAAVKGQVGIASDYGEL